jgi:hypothetical protein
MGPSLYYMNAIKSTPLSDKEKFLVTIMGIADTIGPCLFRIENCEFRNGICYQNCSDLLWEKNVLMIKKNFWSSKLKAENLQNVWDHSNTLFKQGKFRNFLNLFLEVSNIKTIRIIRIQIGKKYWDLETCRKS